MTTDSCVHELKDCCVKFVQNYRNMYRLGDAVALWLVLLWSLGRAAWEYCGGPAGDIVLPCSWERHLTLTMLGPVT